MKMITDKGYEHFPECCIDYITDPSHCRPGIHALHDRLYVVTMVSNPLRFRSKYWNYYTFQNMVEKSGAILYTAEVAYGDREFEITDPNNPRHLQLRSKHEVWLKENALNLVINRLPSDWKYVAWIDADVQFTRPDWIQETIQLLQHYDFLQMFSHAQDLGVNYEPLITTPGFVYGKLTEDTIPDSDHESVNDHYYYGLIMKIGEKLVGWKYRHPGFCWACRRDAYDKVGGLIDWAILGSGDYIMAQALWGQVDRALNSGYTESYKRLCKIWEDRALLHIRKNIGYMPGTVNHYFHGDKKARNYDNRWKLLVDTKFDPLIDIKRDSQGLWQLVDTLDGQRSIELRDGLRKYARLRCEDSNIGIIVP